MSILKEILKNLSAKDTLNCALVCKDWLKMSRDNLIWNKYNIFFFY